MQEEIKVEKIDTVTMYKMIYSLLEYDYFSTKCLVGVFIEKRTNNLELENLQKIKKLLLDFKLDALKIYIKKIVKELQK